MDILVVEDERKVALALKEGLEKEQYNVKVAFDGEDGFFKLNRQPFDLLILDVMLPGRDGLEILQIIRQKGLEIPVLILTARDAVEDRVEGLDMGADDYLVKPFAFPELSARVRALLRRGRPEQIQKLACGDLELNLAHRKARRAGDTLQLTAQEFDLLTYMLRHKNYVVSRDMLARDIWQEQQRGTSLDNVIDVSIARLRKKIDDPFETKLLHTVRGVGYILKEPSA